jgi:hypothetical protein
MRILRSVAIVAMQNDFPMMVKIPSARLV